MPVIKTLNEGVRLILELCALASFAYWGFQSGKVWYLKAILGISAPLLVGIIWGIFGSPGASIPAKGFVHLALEIVIFSLASIGLVASGRPNFGMILAILFFINRILMAVWHQ